MTANMTELAQRAVIEGLEKLREEVRTLAGPLSEQEFWRKPLDPGNSVGHLVLHLTGNLNYFVGAQLGGTGYVRESRARVHRDPDAEEGRGLAKP